MKIFKIPGALLKNDVGFFLGCWVVWEAGTCLRVGVAVARWCVEVRASQDISDRGPLEIPTMLLRYHRMCKDTLPEGAGRLPPAITRVALLCRPASSSAISCEFHSLYIFLLDSSLPCNPIDSAG